MFEFFQLPYPNINSSGLPLYSGCIADSEIYEAPEQLTDGLKSNKIDDIRLKHEVQFDDYVESSLSLRRRSESKR